VSKLVIARTVLLGVVCGALLGSPLLPAEAKGREQSSVSTPDKHSAYRSSSTRRVGSPEDDYDTLTLDMVRDVGVSLRQVRELAIYIFKEATRKMVSLADPPAIDGFDSISEKDLDKDAKYLKPRPGWIFFYVGTLEPTIQLLKDAESERIYIPRKIKEKETRLDDDFDAELEKTRVEIKKLHKYIDGDSHESVDVARSALVIYNAAEAMEKIRAESYEAVRDAEKNGYKDMILF